MNKTEGVPYETAVLILLTLSRGAESRKKILIALLPGPKNCNQLSRETGLDWWTVKKHLLSLMKENLIKSSTFGSAKFYELSLRRRRDYKSPPIKQRKESDLKSSR